MERGERLTKVHIELPNHWATGGESMWAVDLGGDLYELRNTPFHAYGLNFGDIVRATADEPTLKPEIRAVVTRSGHQTLRVFFEDVVSDRRALELLGSLAPLAVSFEGADTRYFALDLLPDADIGKVRDILDEWQEQGWAGYETCEARMPGGFDDGPQEE